MPRLAVVLLVACAAPLHAENWPAFRGADGRGEYPGKVALEWSTSKNVAWKKAIAGHGWSSPIVYDGRVYLTSAVPLVEPSARRDIAYVAFNAHPH